MREKRKTTDNTSVCGIIHPLKSTLKPHIHTPLGVYSYWFYIRVIRHFKTADYFVYSHCFYSFSAISKSPLLLTYIFISLFLLTIYFSIVNMLLLVFISFPIPQTTKQAAQTTSVVYIANTTTRGIISERFGAIGL